MSKKTFTLSNGMERFISTTTFIKTIGVFQHWPYAEPSPGGKNQFWYPSLIFGLAHWRELY